MKRRILVPFLAIALLLGAQFAPIQHARAASFTGGWGGLVTGSWVPHAGTRYVQWAPWGVAFIRTSGAPGQIRIYECGNPANTSPFEPYTDLNVWVYPRPNWYNPNPLIFCTEYKKWSGGSIVYGTLDWDGP